MGEVTLSIDGKSFRMACEDGDEERLTDLAARFDTSVQDLRAAFGHLGDNRLTVMAGLLMTDRLSEVEAQLEASKAERDRLAAALAGASNTEAETRAEFDRRLEAVSDRLAEAARSLNGTAETVENAY